MKELLEIGQQLKAAREEKGLTLEQVSHELKIQVKILEAIEQGQQPAHPPATILKGFIRAYCRLMKIPPPEVVPLNTTEPSSKKAPASVTSPAQLAEQPPLLPPWFKWTTLIIALMLLVFSVQTYRKYQTEKLRGANLEASLRRESQKTEDSTQQLALEPTTTYNTINTEPEIGEAESNSSSPQTTSTTPSVTSSVTHEFAIQVLRPTQMTLIRDGQPDRSKSLSAAKVYLFKSSPPLSIKIDNPSAVRIYKNGRLIPSHYINENKTLQIAE